MADNDDVPRINRDDIRTDDHEYNPALEPDSSKAWLNLLEESAEAFEQWNIHCDRIDQIYANLEQLSIALQGRTVRDKEFQIFWANCEVIKPAIYANPPVPVVVTKFKDRRPVYQQASEVLERCCVVAFDLTRINDLMLLVRDDLAMSNRGVAWCRYESAGGDNYYDTERVCVDFKDRRDFLHSISRNWREVTWVAAASWLTRGEARKRFHATSGDAYQNAEYVVDKEAKEVGGADNRQRAQFWEIWDKSSKRVVWVAKGCKDILDEDDPHLELLNFFPCPKPAYGTVQRGSLVPVPDALQYRDQIDEINLLTARIHALSDALEAKGFYPAGSNELADAIQAAVQTKTSSRMLVPISNWAAFGGTNEVIIWLPIDVIATTIQALVLLRKQIIDDIYQLTGMADIMRGDTDPNETLGAQQLKSQYGTTRIRDKQQELVRLARDLVEISSEIMTSKFKGDTLVEMSQTTLPTKHMVESRGKQIIAEIQHAQQMMMQAQRFQQQQPPQQPQQPQQGQGQPPQPGQPPQQQQPSQQQGAQQQIQQNMQQLTTALQQLQSQVTVDQVLAFLKDHRTKNFVLDIETDSTIMADEDAEKQRRTEFVGVLSQLLPQLGQMIVANPQTAEFCGEVLKFATAPFRAGRALDGAINDLVEQMKQQATQGQQQNPTDKATQTQLQIESMKINYAREKDTADRQVKLQQINTQAQTSAQSSQIDAQAQQAEVAGRQQEHSAKIYQLNQQAAMQEQEHQADMAETYAKQQLEIQKQQAAIAMHGQRMQQQAMRPPPGRPV